MSLTIENKSFSEDELRKLAQQLNTNCGEVDAHGYKDFLKKSTINGVPLIQIIKDLNANTSYQDYEESRELGLSRAEQYKYVEEFFSKLNIKLGKEVSSILKGKNKKYKYEIIDYKNSRAGHSGENEYIDIQVYLIDKLKNFVELPHELSHALSNHHTHFLTLVNNLKKAGKTKDPRKIKEAETKLEDFKKNLGTNDVDCVGEIESHITELLFYRYLLKKGIITEDDFNNERVGRMNSFKSNLETVLEEYTCIKNLSCPITFESAMEFIKKLATNNDVQSKKLLDRMYIMSKREVDQKTNKPKNPLLSKYRMRYIVGEMVSSVWFEKYEKSNSTERKEMKAKFVEFLSNTHKLNLEKSCEFLLDCPFEKVVEEFSQNVIQVNSGVDN